MRDIPEYQKRYAATRKGEIYSFYKKGYLRPGLSGKYYQVSLSKNKISTTFGIHILIAKAYLLNPDNLPIVNHKDGNRGVIRIDKNGVEVAFNSLTKAAQDCGRNKGSYISNACRGRCKKAYGFEWRYAD